MQAYHDFQNLLSHSLAFSKAKQKKKKYGFTEAGSRKKIGNQLDLEEKYMRQTKVEIF